MTKFDSYKTAKRWLCVLEEELPKQLTPATWLNYANARLNRCAAVRANQKLEIRQSLCTIANNTTVQDKIVFIQLLHQELPGGQHNVMMEKQVSTELLTLSQKKTRIFIHTTVGQRLYLSDFLEKIK